LEWKYIEIFSLSENVKLVNNLKIKPLILFIYGIYSL